MPDLEYAPGLLTRFLGWQWRTLGSDPRAHLIRPRSVRRRTTACGIRPGERDVCEVDEDPTYCELCRFRNGGIT